MTRHTEAAAVFLRRQLSGGARHSARIKAAAKKLGISEHHLREAFKCLGVEYQRERKGRDHRTLWRLPEAGSQQAQVASQGRTAFLSPDEFVHPEGPAAIAAREKFRRPLSGWAAR
jgi:hypothetical protein